MNEQNDAGQKYASYSPVQRVLWVVLFANLAVTIVKLAVGIWSGALAILADGFHSLVDTSTNLIGLATIQLARRPADPLHPYGYRRYESVGVLAIGGMLLVSAYEIGESIVTRILEGGSLQVSPLMLVVMLGTFAINNVVYFMERRAGIRLQSEILLADAAHTRADLFITLSVLVGLIGVWLGLAWLDMVLAGLIVVLILRAAFKILRDSASSLTDRIMADPDAVKRIAYEVSGVRFVHNVRSRGAPGFAFVDLHVKVHPGMSTEQAHAIATEVEHRLTSEVDGVVDALVHIEPARESFSAIEGLSYKMRQLADGMGLGIHDLHIRALDAGGFAVELHLEMKGFLSLKQAHERADVFEKRAGSLISEPVQITTHLEPIPDDVIETSENINLRLREKILDVVARHASRDQIIEFDTYRVGGRIGVAAQIGIESQASLNEAHSLAELIERELMEQFPEIHRVTMHVEPLDG